MSHQRAAKIARIQDDIADVETYGEGTDLLVLGWGSTYGAIRTAVDRVHKEGLSVSQAHLRHINPFPKNLGDVLGRYDKVLIPEINLGQLSKLIRAEYGVDSVGYNRVLGQPLRARYIESEIHEILNGEAS
jgi:2-oxoglutarate ferredoxin oxidoreductase subunit alpha